MAAASPDKDFLHVYNKLLQVSDKYNYVNMSPKNIAVWRLINLNEFVNITQKLMMF
jgi:hypothetical protein